MSQEATGVQQRLAYEEPQALPLVVGVDLGGTQIRTAVLRGAELLSRIAWLTDEYPGPERTIPRIYEGIVQALDEARITLHDVAGIGIGAPGPLNGRTGVIFDPPNLHGWRNVPLRALLEEHFSMVKQHMIPVFVENDANAAALGEYMFGAGRGYRELVYLTISTGIGGGIIVDGKIVQGTSGTAGELGHMTIDWHGERCICGNIGCLEYLASGTAIARRANQAIAAGQGSELLTFAHSLQQQTGGQNIHVSASTVAEAAQAGISLAEKIIAEAAEAIGVGLVNIAHIFNPEVIILGGGVTLIGSLLMEPALRIFQERTMQIPRNAARIVLAQLGTDVGLVGAGALVYCNLL